MTRSKCLNLPCIRYEKKLSQYRKIFKSVGVSLLEVLFVFLYDTTNKRTVSETTTLELFPFAMTNTESVVSTSS